MDENIPKLIDKQSSSKKQLVQDIVRGPKTSADLVKNWESSDKYDLLQRDSLIEAMLKRGARPDIWITDRNEATGLYPDIEDPDFAAKLYRKTEFASLRSYAVGEDTCSESKLNFEKTAVQRLVARFLNPSTPYNGILLHHGVGVGKTCSAITVAETFLEVLPMNTVYIIVPQAIADGFKRTIFDVNKLSPNSKEEFRLTGERWKSSQCTGSTYLHLTGLAESDNLLEIGEAVDYEIRRRYKIMGYLAFANFIEAKKKEVPIALTGQERIDAENEKLMALFSDHLIIIDEAHNLRDVEDDDDEESDKGKQTDAREGKKLTPLLKRIILVSEGLRLMMMTATPMYNTAPEIVFLLNLLQLNDTKDESRSLRIKDVFDEEDSSFVEGGEEKLQRIIKRYVSFMRGEHPNTFPLRLTPPTSIKSDFDYPTQSMKISEGLVKLTDTDKNIIFNLPLIVHSLDSSSPMGAVLEKTLKARIEKGAEDEGREVTNLDSLIQLGNLVYPDGTHGKTGFSNYFEEKKFSTLGQKMVQYQWKSKAMPIESMFGLENLVKYSPKIASIVKSITDAKGISFVFSRYKKAGALPIAIALELAGWCRVLANGTPAPLLKRDGPKPTMFYVLLTSDETLSPDFKGLLRYATTLKTDAERNGSKVKAIIGSQIASEGLDLKCIREIHLLEGWFHLNRIEQIEGRGVRFCSHADLPLGERNCLIYLHCLNVPKYETADLYMYRLAIRKAQPIGRVTRLMKINAWDCMLNRDAILLSDLPKRNIEDAQGRVLNGYDLKDKPFTSFCDFSDTCEFLCAMKPIAGENKSTYRETDFRQKLLEKQELLDNWFSEEVASPLKLIRDGIYSDVPWSIGEIALRELLGKHKIKRADGIIGTLIYQNGYIVFQPDRVTDRKIPLASRYGLAYGMLPRTVAPSKSVFTLAAEPIGIEVLETGKKGQKLKEKKAEKTEKAKAEKAEKTEKAEKAKQKTAPAPAPANENKPLAYDDSMAAFNQWLILLEKILTKGNGYIESTTGMSEEAFRGWRWTFYHFRDLPEIRDIANRWWMDNFWSWKERRTVFQSWTETKNTKYSDLFKPVEVFESPKIRGFISCDTNNVNHIYCQTSADSSPKLCPSLLLSDVEKIIGPPVDRMAETESIFGFLSYVNHTIVVKTVLKKGKASLSGAGCVGVSNLEYHKPRLIEIHKYLQSGSIKDLVLQDSAETKPTEKETVERGVYFVERYKSDTIKENPSLEAKHIADLSLKQICPYLEFLLRYADIKRLNGKRWFLSAVEMARVRA